MPPKKKVAAAAKAPKQEISIEPEISSYSSLEPKKIPKKPFFRYVDYDSLNKAQHIHVKLWKIRSCGFPVDDMSEEIDDDEDSLKRKYTEILQNTLKSSTIKKSLKYVKILKSHDCFFSLNGLWRQLGSTWRLDYVDLSAERKFKNAHTLKTFLNSSLKNCYLRFNEDEDAIDPKFIAAFRIVRKCKLMIDSEMNDLYTAINPAKLLPYRKVKLPSRDENFMSHQIIINAPECFQEIYFDWEADPSKWPKENIEFPALPNLEELSLIWKNMFQEEKIVDISFIKQYPKLKSLGISLGCRESETLDFIGDLKELKEFSFFSTQLHLRKGPMRSLPNLIQLKKFALHLDTPIFTMEHVRGFICKNKELKDLDISLKIQNMGIIFEEEDEDFTLPDIEKLRLSMFQLERPYAGGAKRIAEVLKTHDSLKELVLIFSQSYADLNAILLKDGIAKMKSLKKLTLTWEMSGGLEDNKYKHLKDVFTNHVELEALDLDLRCDGVATRELGTILDGLMKLKNLKKFTLKAKLVKMTPAGWNKLSNFLVSLRSLKGLWIELLGISEEYGEQLREKLLPKVSLSHSFFSFSSSSNVTTVNMVEINEDDLEGDLD